MPPLLKLPTLSLKIIKFSIHDNPDPMILIGNGLIAGGEIDDAQPGMPKPHTTVSGNPFTIAVGSAMVKHFNGGPEGLGGYWFVTGEQGSDSAHKLVPSGDRCRLAEARVMNWTIGSHRRHGFSPESILCQMRSWWTKVPVLRYRQTLRRAKLQQFFYEACQVGQNEIMMNTAKPRRSEQHGACASAARSLRILPFVADHKRSVQIQPPFMCRFDKHPWFWFPAMASVAILMRANKQVIDGKTLPKHLMHAIQVATRQIAAGKAWLIGCNDHSKPGRLQFMQQRRHFCV